MTKFKGYPLARKFPPKDIPIIQAFNRALEAMFEVDTMLDVIAEEAKIQHQIMEHYMDEKGKRFQKAQKAALKGDRLLDEAERYRQSKIALWGVMAKTYGTLVGDSAKGVIVADWLCSRKPIDKISVELARSEDFIRKTIAGLHSVLCDLTYCRESLPSSYLEPTMKIMEEYRNA